MVRRKKSLKSIWCREVIHIKLIWRLLLLAVLSLVFGLLTGWKIVMQGLNPWLTFLMTAIGFLLGYYVFSRTNVIVWDEEKEMISVGKMDALGAIVFACYFGFDFLVKLVLADRFDTATTVTGLTLSIVFGTLFGRLIGTLISVQKTHEENV